MLRLLISSVGIEAFTKEVGNCLRKHIRGNITLANLLTELEAASERDLSRFAG